MKSKVIGIVLAVMLVAGLCTIPLLQKAEETIYKETSVTYGKLTVGITESGNISVGTTQQEFGLDISAFSASDSGTATIGIMGGMSGGSTNGGAIPGMFSTAGSSSSSSEDQEIRELEVEEVYISVGEQIAEGEALFKLTQASVDGIRQELESDTAEAQLSYEKLQTEQKSTSMTAQHTLETNTIYGQAAHLEYQEAVNDLTTAVTDAGLASEEKREELSEAQKKLEELQEKQAEDKHLLEEAEYLLKIIDIEDGEDLYGYVTAENSREKAAKAVESGEDEIEDQETRITTLGKELVTLEEKQLESEKEKRAGVIESQKQQEERQIYYENSSEIYGIATEMMEDNLENAEEEYGEALTKLQDFDAYIVDGIVSSEFSGIITEVSVAKEDAIENGQTLYSLNDYEEVTIAVDIEESDIDKIKSGDSVNVSIAALPDNIYTGEVTEISDANVNSSTSVITYEATVKIEGDLDGVYENMSGDVTFITKETKEVLQILNRAVIREGTKSYAKMRDEDGDIVTREIQTGFSDGIHVEILEGLSEGDVVLIESKVNDT